MIEFTKSFRVGDKVFATIEEAQFEEMKQFAPEGLNANSNPMAVAEEFMRSIVQNADKVVDILTTGPNSKPKARAINGGRKARKSKTTTPEPATV